MTEASDVWPDPVDGAPLTSRAAAELALALAAREVADFARTMITTGPNRASHNGVLAGDARQLTALAGRVLAAAVVVERADGTSWKDIAEATGDEPQQARARWQPSVEQWETATENAAVPGAAGPEDEPASTESAIADLDAWVIRHREPRDPISQEHPVSDALRRMDPLHELMHLAAVRRRLTGLHDGAPPPAQLLPLVERQVVLEEHLASMAEGADRLDHEEAAGKARTMAAHLRARTGEDDVAAD